MKSPVFACIWASYLNCPVHNGADGTPQIKFFADVGSIVDFIKEGLNEWEVLSLSRVELTDSGKSVPLSVSYQNLKHSVEYAHVDFMDSNSACNGPWMVFKDRILDKDGDVMDDDDIRRNLSIADLVDII